MKSEGKVEVLVNFLNNWKETATKFYLESAVSYGAEKNQMYKDLKDAGCNARYSALFQIQKKYGSFTVELYERCSDKDWLDKELEREVERKYEQLVNRITKVTGNIENARNLKIGDNGEINGTIVGNQASARIETIMAGGYNIQCLHFRVLVHRI